MTRTSRDELDSQGYLWNGFDYLLQVWVEDGKVLPCTHPLSMRVDTWCCESNRFAGLPVRTIPHAECIAPSLRHHPRFIQSSSE